MMMTQPANETHEKDLRFSQSEISELEKQITLSAKLEGFEIERRIGVGGFGHVYRARDKKLDRAVALKFFVTTDENRIAYTSLKKEAEAASRLNHPNIVQIYGWHNANSIVFYSMELVDGVSLSDYLKYNPDLSLMEILRILAESASGLAAAHQQGILHRDIKPQNILISRSGKVKIADFGLSRAIKENLAEESSNAIIGTLGFMSPEQATGKQSKASCDLYGLAATGYYLISGMSPYSHITDRKELLAANQAGKFKPLLEHVNGLPIDIYRLLTKGLHPQEARRYQNADDFRNDVEHCLLTLDSIDTPSKKFLSIDRLLTPAFFIGLIIGVIAGFFISLVLQSL